MASIDRGQDCSDVANATKCSGSTCIAVGAKRRQSLSDALVTLEFLGRPRHHLPPGAGFLAEQAHGLETGSERVAVMQRIVLAGGALGHPLELLCLLLGGPGLSDWSGGGLLGLLSSLSGLLGGLLGSLGGLPQLLDALLALGRGGLLGRPLGGLACRCGPLAEFLGHLAGVLGGLVGLASGGAGVALSQVLGSLQHSRGGSGCLGGFGRFLELPGQACQLGLALGQGLGSGDDLAEEFFPELPGLLGGLLGGLCLLECLSGGLGSLGELVLLPGQLFGRLGELLGGVAGEFLPGGPGGLVECLYGCGLLLDGLGRGGRGERLGRLCSQTLGLVGWLGGGRDWRGLLAELADIGGELCLLAGEFFEFRPHCLDLLGLGGVLHQGLLGGLERLSRLGEVDGLFGLFGQGLAQGAGGLADELGGIAGQLALGLLPLLLVGLGAGGLDGGGLGGDRRR